MPSAAAVIAYYHRMQPDLAPKQLEVLAKDVAAIVIPKEVHQKVSETFGGHNKKPQVDLDSRDLRAAMDRNFNAIKPTLKEHGATEEKLEAARTKMHKLNESVGLYK